MRAQAQALHFNRSGLARTRDYLMPTIEVVPGRSKRGFGSVGTIKRIVPKPCPGRGGPKKWTGAAIAQAGYAPPELPGRKASKAEGASQGHVRGCGMFTASFVETRQDERSKRLRTESLDNPLEFYITNNMFDETKLFVADPGGRRAKKRRCVALGCQITYKEEHSRGIKDLDIVRPPALVKNCTAEACANVVGKATDPFGIAPDRELLPEAPFYAFITSTDSAATNKKVSKFISHSVAKRNVYVYGTEPPPATPSGAVATPATAHGPAEAPATAAGTIATPATAHGPTAPGPVEAPATAAGAGDPPDLCP